MTIGTWYIHAHPGPAKFGFGATNFEGLLIYWFDLLGTTIYWSNGR